SGEFRKAPFENAIADRLDFGRLAPPLGGERFLLERRQRSGGGVVDFADPPVDRGRPLRRVVAGPCRLEEIAGRLELFRLQKTAGPFLDLGEFPRNDVPPSR